MWGPAAFGAPLIPALLRGTGLGALMATAGLLLFMAGAKPNAAQRGDARLRSVTTAFAVAAPILLGAHLVTWLINTSPDLKFDPGWATSALGTTVGRIELWRVGLTILALWAWWLARRTRLALAFAAGAVVVSGAVGHSAAIAPAWAVPAKAIHLLASAIWVGGLLWLLIRPAGDDAPALRRGRRPRLVESALGGDRRRVHGRRADAAVPGVLVGARDVRVRPARAREDGRVPRAGRVRCLQPAATHTTPDESGAQCDRMSAYCASSVAREVVVIAIVILLGGLLAYVPPPNETEAGMSSGPSAFSSQHATS